MILHSVNCSPIKSWASLVAQLVKNPPAMQETRVRFLGWEDPLDPLQHSELESSMDTPWGLKELDTMEPVLLSPLCLRKA